MAKLKRVIEGYPKERDCLEEEICVNHMSLQMLQKIFGEPSSDPMYECYAIDEIKARHLNAYLDEPLKLNALDYFLVCYSVDDDNSRSS
jgi:hypothetical protein